MKVELKCNKKTAPCNNLCFAIGVLGGKCAVANVKNEEMLSSLFLLIVSAPLCTTVTGRSWGGLYSQQSICLSFCKSLLLIAVELNPGTQFFRGLFGPLNIEAFGYYLPASWMCFSVPLVQFTSHWTYRAHNMHFFFSSF